MLKKIFLIGLIVAGCWTGSIFCLGSGKVFARGDTITHIPIDKLDELAATPSSGNDFIPVWDASAKKDKRLDVDRFDFTETGDFTIGTDTYAMSAGNPGSGTLTLTKFTTYVFSNATGVAQDIAHVPDGSTAGQQKRVVLGSDGETSGTAIAPDNTTITGGAGTSVLLEDVGDSITFEWSGSSWMLVSNIGGTVQ